MTSDEAAKKRARWIKGKEERLAWDRYAASATTAGSRAPLTAAQWADQLLAERRKRFGDGK